MTVDPRMEPVMQVLLTWEAEHPEDRETPEEVAARALAAADAGDSTPRDPHGSMLCCGGTDYHDAGCPVPALQARIAESALRDVSERPDLLTAIEKALELPERDAYAAIVQIARSARTHEQETRT